MHVWMLARAVRDGLLGWMGGCAGCTIVASQVPCWTGIWFQKVKTLIDIGIDERPISIPLARYLLQTAFQHSS